MPRLALRGHSVHYQQIGDGADVVLIHGLLCNIAFWWFTVAPRLAESRRVTALDLRGHGFSAMSESGYRVVDLADDVAQLMGVLGIERAHLVGHSFGGAVALGVALRHPERVTRLTLADAWVPSLQRFPPPLASGSWPELRRRLRARGLHVEPQTPRVVQGLYEELLDTPAGLGGAAPAALIGPASPLGQAGRRPSRALRRWRQLMETTSAHREFMDPTGLAAADLARLTQPADLVYGAKSRYRRNGEALADLLERKHEVTIPDAGHYFPLFRPESLLRVVA